MAVHVAVPVGIARRSTGRHRPTQEVVEEEKHGVGDIASDHAVDELLQDIDASIDKALADMTLLALVEKSGTAAAPEAVNLRAG